MLITTRLGLVAVLSAALFACSSNDTGGSTSSGGSSGTSGGTSGSSGGTSGATSGGTSGTSGSQGTAPAAPKLDAVAQMMNVLHVKWTADPSTKCDSIEAERKANMPDGAVMEEYKVAFTVAGDIDNKMDSGATAAMKYTYRLRCKVGTAYSPYSNEASGTPKP